MPTILSGFTEFEGRPNQIYIHACTSNIKKSFLMLRKVSRVLRSVIYRQKRPQMLKKFTIDISSQKIGSSLVSKYSISNTVHLKTVR